MSGPPPPIPTLDLNVDNNSQFYQDFILRLRQAVADPGRFSHDRPVLPPQEQTPTQWIDILLQTGDRRLRVRVQRNNLYVQGFRNEDGGEWYEFNESPRSPHLIQGSTCTLLPPLI